METHPESLTADLAEFNERMAERWFARALQVGCDVSMRLDVRMWEVRFRLRTAERYLAQAEALRARNGINT